jgi:DNA polymerase I-like protein with 3'-5' exonuclease and polymerase domains
VRAIYIARKRGRYLLKCDYSQIEMRLIAYLSGDPELQKAVETDAHLYIMYLVDKATDLYGLWGRGFEQLLRDYREEDPDVVFARDETKRTDYGWGYRMGAKKLENVRGDPYERGKRALQALNQEFHYVVEWWSRLVAEVESASAGSGLGHLVNEYGRIRHLFTEDVPRICNFKPQSLAADILFDAMVALEKGLKDYDAELLLTVHDEVVVDAPSLDVVPFIREVMERPVPELDGLVVPVDVMAGRNWAKHHEHTERCKDKCRKPENPNGQRELKHVA